MESEELVCYNRGCAQRFKEADNVEGQLDFYLSIGERPSLQRISF